MYVADTQLCKVDAVPLRTCVNSTSWAETSKSEAGWTGNFRNNLGWRWGGVGSLLWCCPCRCDDGDPECAALVLICLTQLCVSVSSTTSWSALLFSEMITFEWWSRPTNHFLFHFLLECNILPIRDFIRHTVAVLADKTHDGRNVALTRKCSAGILDCPKEITLLTYYISNPASLITFMTAFLSVLHALHGQADGTQNLIHNTAISPHQDQDLVLWCHQ